MDVAASLDRVTLDLAGRRVLDGVSFDVPAATLTALVGPNGCGKSTVARMLAGFIHPTDGVVRVLGRRIGEVDVHALRERVSLVQPSTLHEPGPSVSVRDVVLTGAFGTVDLHREPNDADRSRADVLIGRLGLDRVADRSYRTCSSGERMRAQLARSLLSRPALLVLDEPTSGLDLPMREKVLTTIDAILAGPESSAVLLVTHHLEELPTSTRHAVVMAVGRVHAAGDPATVLTSATLSAAFAHPIEVTRSADGRYAARSSMRATLA